MNLTGASPHPAARGREPAAGGPVVELVSPLTAPPRPRTLMLWLMMGLVLLSIGVPAVPAADAAAGQDPAVHAPAAQDSGAGSEHPTPSWRPPVVGAPEVLRPFAAPPAPWAAGHRGVDLAAAEGSPVLSPADGVVSFVGVVVDRPVVSLDHGDGLVSAFEPVETDREVGDVVAAGDTIGTLARELDGSSHCAGASCLHWGVRLHGDYLNPLLLTGDLEPSVLLPLSGERSEPAR